MLMLDHTRYTSILHNFSQTTPDFTPIRVVLSTYPSPNPSLIVPTKPVPLLSTQTPLSSHSSSSTDSLGSFPIHLATTGVKITVGGNRIGEAAL